MPYCRWCEQHHWGFVDCGRKPEKPPEPEPGPLAPPVEWRSNPEGMLDWGDQLSLQDQAFLRNKLVILPAKGK
jgi:hypothetical protein